MKKIPLIIALSILLIAAATPEINQDTPIKGAWKVVRSQYGNEPMTERPKEDLTYKLFTGTRWASTFYNSSTNTISGTCGGTYTIKGNQYVETIEYYSWDPAVAGKTVTFTMTIENGMLHQKGTMEYKGNPNYIIDEWYVRVD